MKKRLFLGFCLPIVAGVILIYISTYISFLENETPLKAPSLFDIGAIFIYAILFMGLQSLIYTFTMELVINPRFKRNVIVYLLSTLLGVLAALPVALLSRKPELLYIVGCLTGLFVGWILRRDYLSDKAT